MAKSYKMVFDERSKNLSFTQVVPNKNTHIFVSLIIEYVQYNIYIYIYRRVMVLQKYTYYYYYYYNIKLFSRLLQYIFSITKFKLKTLSTFKFFPKHFLSR